MFIHEWRLMLVCLASILPRYCTRALCTKCATFGRGFFTISLKFLATLDWPKEVAALRAQLWKTARDLAALEASHKQARGAELRCSRA